MHHISTQWQQRHKSQWCNRLNCSLVQIPNQALIVPKVCYCTARSWTECSSADLCNFFKEGQLFRPARGSSTFSESKCDDFFSLQERLQGERVRGVELCNFSIKTKRKANFGQQKIGSTFFGEQAKQEDRPDSDSSCRLLLTAIINLN